MIVLFVFYIHTIVAAVAFTKRWQEEGWWEGIIAVGFVALIFSVGWTITTFISRFLMDQEGFGKWFDRDAFALALLTLIEGIFYIFQTQRKKRRAAAQP